MAASDLSSHHFGNSAKYWAKVVSADQVQSNWLNDCYWSFVVIDFKWGNSLTRVLNPRSKKL